MYELIHVIPEKSGGIINAVVENESQNSEQNSIVKDILNSRWIDNVHWADATADVLFALSLLSVSSKTLCHVIDKVLNPGQLQFLTHKPRPKVIHILKGGALELGELSVIYFGIKLLINIAVY